MRHVVDSPWWLLWLFARPKTRAMARWNRLEQAEVAAQTASLNLRPPASCNSFVRARGPELSARKRLSAMKRGRYFCPGLATQTSFTAVRGRLLVDGGAA